MNNFERDSFIFSLTREQLIEFRDNNYMGYLYMKLQEIKGVDDTDTKCFYNFLEGTYDSLSYFDFDAVKTTIQNCIWTVSDVFPNDWGIVAFKEKHRSNQIDKLI